MPKGNKGVPKTKEHTAKMRLSIIEAYKNGTKMGFKKGDDNLANLPEIKEKISKALKGRKRSKEQIERNRKAQIGLQAGSKNPMWKGGISYEPYGVSFNKQLKRVLRSRDRNICNLCGLLCAGRNSVIHHVDYDKKNDNANNLMTLCKRCHGKTNANRNYWSNYLKGILLCNLLNH